ncbi:hypothetical protein MASR2M117_25530 [Paludibacter sp.]
MNLRPGVDLSRMNNASTSYTPQNHKKKVSKSLIKSNFYTPTIGGSNLSSSIGSNAGSHTALNQSISQYRSMSNAVASGTSNTGGAAGGSLVMVPRGGNSNSTQGGNAQSYGLPSYNNSATSSSIRLSAPINPNDDYKEGDLTHPGGNPTENIESVPVGDGTFTLLLMAVVYSISLIFRQFITKKSL